MLAKVFLNTVLQLQNFLKAHPVNPAAFVYLAVIDKSYSDYFCLFVACGKTMFVSQLIIHPTAFCISFCFPGSNQQDDRASQPIFQNQFWTLNLVILNFDLSKSQLCWRL